MSPIKAASLVPEYSPQVAASALVRLLSGLSPRFYTQGQEPNPVSCNPFCSSRPTCSSRQQAVRVLQSPPWVPPPPSTRLPQVSPALTCTPLGTYLPFCIRVISPVAT